MKNKKLLGNIMLLVTAAIWGIAFVFQRTGMEYVGPFTFGASRMTLSAVMIWAVTLAMEAGAKKGPENKRPSGEYKRNSIIGGLCCGCALMAATTTQQIGLIYTEAGKAGFLTALYIVLVPVISLVVLKRRMSLITAFGVVLGTAGLYLLSINGDFVIERGDAFVIVCAVCFSIQILLIDHFVVKAYPIMIAAVQFTVCAVISWVLAFIFETPDVEGIGAAASGILYCGILSGGCGYTFQMAAQKYTEPTAASLLMSLESVFALIGGTLILHEVRTTREIIGCIIMFAAIIIVQLPASFGGGKEEK